MSQNHNHNSSTQRNRPSETEIRVKGQLDERWQNRFDGLTITPTQEGDTLLSGSVPDQAALFGLLRKVRDLGLYLVSVYFVEPKRPE